MDFITFFNAVSPYIDSTQNREDLARKLFLAICEDGSHAQREVYELNPSTIRSYLTRGSISRIAKVILPYLDSSSFSDVFNGLSTEALSSIISKLAEYGIFIAIEDFDKEITNLFVDIIKKAASKKNSGNKSMANDEFDRVREVEVLSEFAFRCPRCGAGLKKTHGGAGNNYEIVQSFFPEMLSDYKVKMECEKLVGNISERDIVNEYTPLCLSCVSWYKGRITPEKYAELIKCRDKAIKAHEHEAMLQQIPLEDEIVKIINSLNAIKESSETKLSYSALKIERKIDKRYALLREQVQDQVLRYYQFIRELLMDKDLSKDYSFERLALNIKLIYLELRDMGLSQEEIYQKIADYIQKTSGSSSYISCQIITSFFIQNCEVFDEITE